MKENKRNNIRLSHYAGKILSYYKQNQPKEFKNLIKALSYTRQWVNFLINMYKLIEKYPGMQQVGTSLRFIRKNFNVIRKVLNENQKRVERINVKLF